MAKPRFHVSMIVDAAALYEVTTAAAKRAYNVQITPVVDDDQPGAKANGADPDAVRTPARIVLYPWWLKHKTFNIADVMSYAKEHGGYTKGAVYTATAEAIKHGLLERTSSGVYKTIPAALKAAVKSAAKPAVIVRKTDSDRQHGHGDFIIDLLKKNGPLLRNAINAEFVSSGRPVRSSDGAMHRLRQKKLIKQNADKTWELTVKGIEQGAE